MIDFKELPRDGRAFEQFVREICLVSDLRPYWTGLGPDEGSDLIITESLRGTIETLEHRWLVQCKHFAHGGKAVGRNDVGHFVDDCRQASADGYLLVTSTCASSGLARKLREISAKSEYQLRIAIWDAVHLEGLLAQPRLILAWSSLFSAFL
jgi:hypothetical protein